MQVFDLEPFVEKPSSLRLADPAGHQQRIGHEGGSLLVRQYGEAIQNGGLQSEKNRNVSVFLANRASRFRASPWKADSFPLVTRNQILFPSGA